MRLNFLRKLSAASVLAFFICTWAGVGESQEILLDKMEKCGSLLCYPSLEEPEKYYYLPDRPRLAYRNGKPQFSFLKYARTRAEGRAGTGRAEGGGIIHFLVTYGASEHRVSRAENELRERHPDALIAGPVVYRKGRFALITSFKEGEDLTTRTVAVGKAPLMEGQKTAVSMALTREGAELLWESFKSDTPDISLVFEMEFAGVREPYEATLEADWKRVSRHDRVKAGFKYKWFGADVDLLFQELRRTGAVKITTKGENKSMDNILQSANEKLLKVMFDPVPADELTRAAEEKNSYDSLDRAVKLLKDAAELRKSASGGKKAEREQGAAVQKACRDNEAGPRGFLQKNARRAFCSAFFAKAYAADPMKVLEDPGDVSGIGDSAPGTDAEGQADEGRPPENCLDSIKPAEPGSGVDDEEIEQLSQSIAYNKARSLYEKARKNGFPENDTQAALDAYIFYRDFYEAEGSRAEEVDGRIRMLRKRLEKSSAGGEPAGKGPQKQEPDSPSAEALKAASPDSGKGGAAALKKAEKKAKGSADASNKKGAGKKEAKKKAASARKAISKGEPGFSLVASYRMKRIRRSGRLVYKMNHFRAETQSFAMAENIGPVYRKYGNDPRVFRAVTIDDPVFKQREVLVTLDGQDASTFTKYMNFVAVKMKKRHQQGEVSTGEVVVTPEAFNISGNHFTMTYGWKNDSDRSEWLSYKYQAVWSFHGGAEIRTPWKKTDSPMLALTPPHRYRTVSIEGQGGRLSDAGVRHAVVALKCRIGDHYVTRKATIRNRGPAPSLVLDIPEDSENPETYAKITWYLNGNRKISSEESRLEGNIIYWDELPGGGV